MHQVCHCEEAAGRRGALSAQREEVPLGCNLAGSGWITGQLRRIRKLVREIATGAKRPRNDNSGVHTILAMACTDRQHCAGPGCPLPYNGVYGRREYPEICSCHRRSVSTATDAIGWCVFIGTLYELEVPSRDCHVGLRPPRNDNSGVHTILAMACTDCKCLPEIATGAKRPRNDNSGVHTILTMACTDRQHCAGPGCPLPCNLTTKNACCSCSRRSFYLLRDFVLCSYWRQPAMRLSESDMNCFSFSSKVCGPLGALS